MKILREGIIQPVDKTWWHGRTAKCSDCGCVVELEEKDGKPGAQHYVNCTSTLAYCKRPTCGDSCRVSLNESRFYAAAGVNRQ